MGLTLQSERKVTTALPKDEIGENHMRLVMLDRYPPFKQGVYDKKRMLDLIGGAVGAAIYFILFPFIALAIKLSSRGPVLFKQDRVGKDGSIFQCYKFRSMHMDEQKEKDDKPDVTDVGDDRIFPFGQFMRRYNIDEIPQFLNVIKGDMSLVGPRPYHVEESTYWDSIFEDYRYRYIVPPGITGFAQARGYRGGTLDDELMRTRLDNDLIYVEKNSLKLDLVIMQKTALQMVMRKTNGH